jgi:hypothetical protein
MNFGSLSSINDLILSPKSRVAKFLQYSLNSCSSEGEKGLTGYTYYIKKKMI